MRISYCLNIAAAVLLCGFLTAGCKSTGKPASGTGTEDVLTLRDVDEPLGDRFMEGERVGPSFESVHFAYDSFQIKRSEIDEIESVYNYMKRNPGVRLVVEGHCDERGSREYNISLGERRALAVRSYLIGLGIDSSRIQTRSYGEERPADPSHNERAWRLNRRAEFVLIR
ncbi:MAG: OmpA family protein [Kiritimatiellia bacterium]